MYKDLCQHNNMLLIFDDTPEMFNTEQKIALWKNAMEDQEKKRVLRCPDGSAKDSSSVYYPTTDPLFTRQDQYYREIGKFTAQERELWIEKRKKEILKTHLKGLLKIAMEEYGEEILQNTEKFEKYFKENSPIFYKILILFLGKDSLADVIEEVFSEIESK